MSAFPVSVKAVLKIAEEAGALLSRMQGKVNLYHKPNGSPYTEADIAANAFIREALSKLTPDIPIVAEEDDRSEAEYIIRMRDTYWLVDPLDVTTNYVEGGKAWSANIALLKEGVPVLGVLEFPGRGERYYTGDEGKAYRHFYEKKPEVIHVKSMDDEDYVRAKITNPVVIAAHPSHLSKLEATDHRGVRLVTSNGQHRACLVASGEALLCSERAGFKAWDSAPTFAIMRAAGGDMWEEDGRVLSFRHKVQLPVYHVGHQQVLETLIGEMQAHTPEEILP
jgi:3'(2'), 5'-bisphosphate nucleotidase